MLNDLGILYESSSWIIVSYHSCPQRLLLMLYRIQRYVRGNSCEPSYFRRSRGVANGPQLLWGRVSDLYSAKPVFAYGFLGKFTAAM